MPFPVREAIEDRPAIGGDTCLAGFPSYRQVDLVKKQPGGTIMTGYDRITFDPQILGGRACIRGMRLSVSLIVNLVAQGMTAEQIVSEYPALEIDDVRQALQYAAALTNEEIHPLTGSPL
jgi:uncharacterized protein (DUF433 family)